MGLNSLRTRMVLIAAGLLLLTGLLSLIFFERIADHISTQLSSDFSSQHVLWQKERIGGVINRELALAQKMVDSMPIRRWLMADDDEAIAAEAALELESFRRLFDAQSYFAVPTRSQNYYFADEPQTKPPLIKQLDRDLSEDSWYFSTLKRGAPININIDVNHKLQTTRVWFNLLAYEEEEVIGIIGTGLELTDFIADLIASPEAGVETMLLSSDLAVTAHEDPELITFNLLSREEEEIIRINDLLDSSADQHALEEAFKRLRNHEAQTITLQVQKAGTPHILSAAWLPEIEWFALTLVDSRHLYGSREFIQLALIMGGALVAVVVLLGLFFSHLVLSPLNFIARAADRIAGGAYHTRLNLTRKDEIGMLGSAFDHMSQTVEEHTRNLEQKVQERTLSLKEANSRLNESIAYAGLIQSSLLPSQARMANRFGEQMVIFKPKDQVGGDLYLLFESPEGSLLGLADCTGHGVAGAMMTMTLHATLTQLTQEMGLAHPARLLGALNNRMRTNLNSEEKSRMDNGLEMGLVFIDRRAQTLRFAGARVGLYRIQNKKPIRQRGDRQSLGYRRTSQDFLFHEEAFKIEPECTYLMLTDGLLDQSGGEKGLPFGVRRFNALLATLDPLPLAKQQAHIEAALREFQGEYPQRDDITLVAFRNPKAEE